MMYAGDECYGDDVTSGIGREEPDYTWWDTDPECPECFGTDLDGVRIKRCSGCGYAWDDKTGEPVNPSHVKARRAEYGE